MTSHHPAALTMEDAQADRRSQYMRRYQDEENTRFPLFGLDHCGLAQF
jgi:hypothetical protein